MTMVTGIVQEISQKDISTKFGVKPTYSFKVDGSWIKCGFKNPKVEVGYQIDCEVTDGTYGKETKGVNVISRSGTPPSATSAPTSVAPYKASGGGFKDRVFPIPALHGDRSIVRQNALARAVELLVGSFGGKTFALDIVETSALVISLARKLEAYTAGDLDLEEAQAEVDAETTKS